MVGILDGNPSISHLFYSVHLEKSPDHQNVQAEFEKSLELLYGNDLDHSKIYLLLSDSAKYMTKFVNNLKESHLYPNLLHVKCLAHFIHIICNNIRKANPNVDKFFTMLNKFFISNIVKYEFKRITKLPIPRKIIRTRWGSFINLASYVHKNFNMIKRFLNLNIFKSNTYLKSLRKCINARSFKNDLANIHEYNYLTFYIKTLENPNLLLSDSLKIIDKIRDKLKDQTLLTKFNNLVNNNKDLSKLIELSNHDNNFIYSQIVSVDIERSFSIYHRLLRTRPNILVKNLMKILVIQSNSNKL